MRFFKTTVIALMALALMATATSCKKDKDEGEQDKAMKAVVEQYLQHTVYVTYTNLAAKAEQLVVDLEALKSDKTQANLDKACATFLDAREWWEKSEAFLYGTASDFGIDPHIDSWPLDEDRFNTMMAYAPQIEAMAGEDGDVYAGESLGSSLLGFHGIEYILFRDGHARNVSDISANDLIYAVAVAGDLRNRTYQLEVSWVGADAAPKAHVDKLDDIKLAYTVSSSGNSYGQNMLNAGKAGSTYSSLTGALMDIIDGCRSIADEVGTSKIGKPYNGEDPDYIESPYSQKSITDFYNNIISIQNAYFGGVEGQRDDAKSLHQYVANLDAALDTKVVDAINNALAKIQAMPVPFVSNYTDAKNGEAVAACTALDGVLFDVITALREK